MSSFIYFYSKFTEEFLLLGGAGIFTLLSAYCYHWVIKRRRLGAARSQVPAGVVKAYLNQLINEAQFVRTQLFGLISGDPSEAAKLQSLFLKPNFEAGSAPAADAMAAFQASSPSAGGANLSGSVPSDLIDRLKALESQLAAKESLVVNINVEKTKLLEEIENLKQNQKALQNSSAMSAGQDELLKKIKNLEERLEEYSLFEDDLANLKRLQQENNALKKRLEDSGASSGPALTIVPAAAAEPVVETLIAAPTIPIVDDTRKPAEPAKKVSLDQNSIDSLLDGMSPIEPAAKPQEAAAAEPSVDPVAPAAKTAAKNDEFENLVDSVESSLNKPSAPASSPALSAVPGPAAEISAAPAPAAKTAAPSPAQAAAPAAPAATGGTPTSEKSDEELLKEFENLLNS